MLPDERAHNVYDDVIRCEAPPPSLNSTNSFNAHAKFKDCQYFWLYGINFNFAAYTCRSVTIYSKKISHIRVNKASLHPPQRHLHMDRLSFTVKSRNGSLAFMSAFVCTLKWRHN